jgi:C_GCAxxG_C_C family probable redox protein
MNPIPLETRRRFEPETEALIGHIRERARRLYLSRRLMCTEAVLVALNEGFQGGLSEDQAVAMAAPFCAALGDSGCMCGALSGAVLASGLLLGNSRPYRYRRDMRNSARQLHNTFKATTGATCCRVLSQKIKHDKKAHFQQCADLTAEATEMAARLILEKRPELAAQASTGNPAGRRSPITDVFLRLWRNLAG